MKNRLCSLILCFPLLASLCQNEVFAASELGCWQAEAGKENIYDEKLAQGLAVFFRRENAQNIIDFSSEIRDYAKNLMRSGFCCEGYDEISSTLMQQSDWVLCLDIQEHILNEFETVFIECIDRYAKEGVVLSLAVKDQQDAEYGDDCIKNSMLNHGYFNDVDAEGELRAVASFFRFKKTIMVFRKI